MRISDLDSPVERALWAASRILTAVCLAVVIVIAAIDASALLGGVTGTYRMYTIESDSMGAGYPVGTVVIDIPRPSGEVKVGDVITFTDPTAHEITVTHRVVSVTGSPVGPALRTRGDANNVEDAWVVYPGTEDVWVAVARIPDAGPVLRATTGASGFWLMLMWAQLLAASGLARMWLRARARERHRNRQDSR